MSTTTASIDSSSKRGRSRTGSDCRSYTAIRHFWRELTSAANSANPFPGCEWENEEGWNKCWQTDTVHVGANHSQPLPESISLRVSGRCQFTNQRPMCSFDVVCAVSIKCALLHVCVCACGWVWCLWFCLPHHHKIKCENEIGRMNYYKQNWFKSTF